jgi:hypothetical protein
VVARGIQIWAQLVLHALDDEESAVSMYSVRPPLVVRTAPYFWFWALLTVVPPPPAEEAVEELDDPLDDWGEAEELQAARTSARAPRPVTTPAVRNR